MGDSVITFLTHYSNEQNYHFRFPYSAQQKIDFIAVSDEQNIDQIIKLYPRFKIDNFDLKKIQESLGL